MGVRLIKEREGERNRRLLEGEKDNGRKMEERYYNSERETEGAGRDGGILRKKDGRRDRGERSEREGKEEQTEMRETRREGGRKREREGELGEALRAAIIQTKKELEIQRQYSKARQTDTALPAEYLDPDPDRLRPTLKEREGDCPGTDAPRVWHQTDWTQ